MWKILHDQGKPLCFVGWSGLTRQCMDMLAADGITCESVSLEDLADKKSDWIYERQFICLSADLELKKRAAELLENVGADVFSLVGRNNAIHPDLEIGHGTFINEYNDLLGRSIIGNYVIISCFCQLGRDVTVEDYCHISSYCYLNNCRIGSGTALGIRSSVLGAKLQNDQRQIAQDCNFLANSVITKDVKQPGTYFGNRRVSSETRTQNRLI